MGAYEEHGNSTATTLYSDICIIFNMLSVKYGREYSGALC